MMFTTRRVHSMPEVVEEEGEKEEEKWSIGIEAIQGGGTDI